jgi:hypothetical protein
MWSTSKRLAIEPKLVDKKRHRWIGRTLVLLQFTNAANLKIAWTRSVAGPIEVWDERQYILKMLLTGIVQRGRTEYGNAARHFGQRDGLQRSRDNDFVEWLVSEGQKRQYANCPRKRCSKMFETHAPSAGTNRIRFNGFTGGLALPASQALKATPAILEIKR